MGQRSQIYVRYEKDGKNYLTARYYQWNYGERMISRCRWTVEWIKNHIEFDWFFTGQKETLMRYMDVNFDMRDVTIGNDIVKECNEYCKDIDCSFNDCVFKCQDNNDGKLFIHIKEGKIKYAFLDHDCNIDEIMDAEQYMAWDRDNWIDDDFLDDEEKETVKTNLEEIEKLATLMTKEEVEDFIGCIYEEEIKPF